MSALCIGLCATTWSVVHGQNRTDRRGTASTVFLARPSEATRIARVESLSPVEIKGEPPIHLTIRQWMETFRVPGLSVAVFDHHELVWAKAYGVKEAGGSDPVTVETLFQAASISKPVTAMAALHFVEAGRWQLDENINDRLTSWKVPENAFTKEQKVTLRRLLSHTAGTTVHGFAGYGIAQPAPTLVQVLNGEPPANSPPVRVDLVPGTRERYSGGGTTIVQLMMVDQLKQPFPQIMREAVLQPLGLQNSTFEQPLPSHLKAFAATGTYADGLKVAGGWFVHPEMAAAGLWTTPSDLARIAIEVSKASAGASARVLSQAMTREMLTEQKPGVGLGFGLGPGQAQFRHNGANQGFQANLMAFADTGSGLAIMTNSDNGSMIFDCIAASVAKEYKWGAFTSRQPPPSTTVSLLAYIRGVERALAWYRNARTADTAGALGPGVLNEAGYILLRGGKTAEAVRVFEANTGFYPQDANAYDSLGDGRMTAGLKAAAIASYRKSLELNPKNDHAISQLEKLGVRWTPKSGQTGP